MSVILVEQYIDFAKNAGDLFYVLERGSVDEKGPIADLDDDLVDRYLMVLRRCFSPVPKARHQIPFTKRR